jgi:myo-inositol-hexaphosphate 3-phosphohydrolase
MSRTATVAIVSIVVVVGAGFGAKEFLIDHPRGAVVKAVAETAPVRGEDDAADDVAIYVDPVDASRSRILTADKQKGLAIHDLAGKELGFVELEKANNIDIRQNVKLGDREITLVAVGENSLHTVQLYEFVPDAPHLRPLPGGRVRAGVNASGIALHRSPSTGIASLYVLGRERSVEQDEKLDIRIAAEREEAGDDAPPLEFAAIKWAPPAAAAMPAELDPAREARRQARAEKRAKRAAEKAKAAGVEGDASESATAGVAKAEPTEIAIDEAAMPAAQVGDENVASAAEKPRAPAVDAAEATDTGKGSGKKSGKAPGKADEPYDPRPRGDQKRGYVALQLRIGLDDAGRVAVEEARRIRLTDAVEGAVCDDESNALFICEEERGILRYRADVPPLAIDVGELICKVGFPNPLRADVEGIAIWHGEGGQGYLVVSSQGSNDYVVLQRQAPHDFVGRFSIGDGDGIDGVDDTDGIDVTSANLGGPYSRGVLIVQDEHNESPTGEMLHQNFKLVPWSAVAEALGI